ncbi:hypothetical protein C8J57DRAFT_1505265 [Mycena rebaudengoi]|nr:hypothetical protein C8J57DRAFT_1505265 [Mycena rebaudengoi]
MPDLWSAYPVSFPRATSAPLASSHSAHPCERSQSMTVKKHDCSDLPVDNIKACTCSMIQTSIHPATAALARHIKSAYSKDHLLAFGAPVTIMIWMFDGRVRLADNAEAINVQDGWDDYDTGYFELWMVNKWGVGTWEKAKWNTPLKVPTGNTLLIRNLGVTEMHNFDTYERHMCQI